VQSVIHLSNVNIVQDSGIILKDVNLVVHETEFIFLIGRTGSGKSSLLKIIYGELPLNEGEGTVAGYNLRTLRRKEIPLLRRKIGIVFQDFQLLTDRTVKDNLMFVLGATGWSDTRLMEKRAEEVLQLTGVETKINAMPHQLSGGEQQRVTIARALLNKPAIILADEPTGNLDPETSEEVMRLLLAVSKEENSSVIMATHDIRMVEKFPAKTYKIDQSMLVAL
jgi:cell division transport system ATP-binding protein